MLIIGVTIVPLIPHVGHVFLLVEENHSLSSVIGNPAMPFLNSLSSQNGLATQYFANTHPSIGNYFMLTTGQIISNDDSFTGTVSQDNVIRQLLLAGKTWKSYAESLPSIGWTGGDVSPYLKRHNPFSYFSDVVGTSQAPNLVPFTQFATDLATDQLPHYSYIVPNAQNDAHDCPAGMSTCSDDQKLRAADDWLRINISPLLNSALFQQDGLLIILFEESFFTDTANGGGQVPMLVISSKVKAGFRSVTFYQHQSTLRLTLEMLDVRSFPGASAAASEMVDFFP